MTSSLEIRDVLDAINTFCTPQAWPPRYNSGSRLRLNDDRIPVIGVVSTTDSLNQATVHRSRNMVHEVQDFQKFSVCWTNDNVAIMFDFTRVEMLGDRLIGVARRVIVQLGRKVILSHESDIDVTFEPGFITVPREILELCNRVFARP